MEDIPRDQAGTADIYLVQKYVEDVGRVCSGSHIPQEEGESLSRTGGHTILHGSGLSPPKSSTCSAPFWA